MKTKWKLLKEFNFENEAIILQGLLESGAIASRISCDNVGGLHAGLSLGAAKIFVYEEDFEEACKVLASLS